MHSIMMQCATSEAAAALLFLEDEKIVSALHMQSPLFATMTSFMMHPCFESVIIVQ